MITLNVNGFEMTGRLPFEVRSAYRKHGLTTEQKRQIMASAFDQMPDHMVEKLWDSAVNGERHLSIVPKEKTE